MDGAGAVPAGAGRVDTVDGDSAAHPTAKSETASEASVAVRGTGCRVRPGVDRDRRPAGGNEDVMTDLLPGW
jgi:hypothetical protein